MSVQTFYELSLKQNYFHGSLALDSYVRSIVYRFNAPYVEFLANSRNPIAVVGGEDALGKWRKIFDE